MTLLSSVKNRTLILLLFVTLIPSFILLSLYYQQTKQTLIQLAGEELLESTFLLARDLDRLLAQRASEIKVISQADVFEKQQQQNIEQYLKEINQESRYLDAIDVYDLNFHIIASSDPLESKAQNVAIWPSEVENLIRQATILKQGEVLFTNIFYSEGEYYLKLLTPITDDTNTQVIKILVTTVSLKQLRLILDEFDERISGNYPIQILNNDGIVILSNQNHLQGETFIDLATNPDLLADLYLPQQNISRQYTNFAGVSVIAGFADMSEFGLNQALDWSVHAAIPTSLVLESMQPVLATSFTMFGIFALLVAFIAYFVAKSISEPIIKLTKYTLDKQVKVDDIHGGTEIEILRDHIVSSQEHLENLNQSLEQRVAKRTNELQETREQVIEQEKMASLGRMVAGISHEVNTPLGLIVTAISHLKEQTDIINDSFKLKSLNSKQLQEYLSATGNSISIVENASNRAVNLIQSFKQVAVDQSCEEFRTVDLKQFVEEVITTLGPTLKKLPHQIHVNCPSQLIQTDSGALYQIITNLILNSVTHAFSDQQSGNIYLSIEKSDHQVVLDYKDDGVGVKDEDLNKIFEPFYTTKRGEGGSGLGTHIIYNLVTQRLRGSIYVTSAKPTGLQFKITFPI